MERGRLRPLVDQGGGSPRRRRQVTAGVIAEGLRSLVAERAVRALAVVLDAPELDLCPGAVERWEVRLGEALVAEAPVEALDVTVLRRLAGLDEVDLHAVLERPAVQRGRDEFGTVVDAKCLGHAVL